MNEPVVLHAAARHDVGLGEVLEHATPGSVALLSTPWEYHIARVDVSGRLETHRGSVRLEYVFDARIFDEHAELRWTDTANALGTAVFLSEDATALPADFSEPIDPVHTIGTRPGAYLLWGRSTGTGAANGWTTLATERIGTLTIPAEIPEQRHAQVVTREYIARDSKHGNAYVAEERLLRFDLATPEEASP